MTKLVTRQHNQFLLLKRASGLKAASPDPPCFRTRKGFLDPTCLREENNKRQTVVFCTEQRYSGLRKLGINMKKALNGGCKEREDKPTTGGQDKDAF